MKLGGCLARHARFDAPTCLVSSLWFSCGLAVSTGEASKPLLFEGLQAGCHVVLRGRRGTLWHSNLFDNASKLTKLEEVLHEMLVLLLPRVSSGVSGFQSTLYTLHSTLYTPHSTLYSLHSAFYTSQFPLHASHSTLYIPHFTLCIPHSTLYTLHFRCTRLCK